ncbi:MAG: 50S ribosomal protein L21 [Patescibacteria group bacterium]
MYAIIRVGGSQYRVVPKQTLVVSRLKGEVGDNVQLPVLMMVDGTTVTIGKDSTDIKANAKITQQKRGEKIDIRRFQAKSRYRKHTGFRPYETTLMIESIGEKKEVPETKTKKDTIDRQPTKRLTAK